MRIRKVCGAVFGGLLTLCSAGAEVAVTAESGVFYAPDSREIVSESGLILEYETYHSFSPDFSFFADGKGSFSWRSADEGGRVYGEAGCEGSYLTDADIILGAVNGEFSWDLDSGETILQIGPEFYWARDYGNGTLYSGHKLFISVFGKSGITYTGSLGYPFLTDSGFLLEPSLKGGASSGEDADFFFEPGFRFSWYPGTRYYAESQVDYRIISSDGIIHEVDIIPVFSLSINRRSRLYFTLPLTVQSSTVTEELWLFSGPGIVYYFSLSPSLHLTASGSDAIEKHLTGEAISHNLSCILQLKYSP